MKTYVDNCVNTLTDALVAMDRMADSAWEGVNKGDSTQVQVVSELVLACNDVKRSIENVRKHLARLDAFSASPRVHEQGSALVAETGLAPAAGETGSASTDDAQGHLLSEDLDGQRPRGYVLDGVVHRGIKTWKRIYLGLCGWLAERSPAQFRALPDNKNLLTPRKRALFAREKGEMKYTEKVSSVWIDLSGTTGMLCSRMRQLLREFGLPEDSLRIYLKGEEDSMPGAQSSVSHTTAFAGQPWRTGADGFKNPYRVGSDYHSLFGRMVSDTPVTSAELMGWFMHECSKTESQAKASVDVVTSPVRDAGCMKKPTGNICGNYSAQGHLYYVEEGRDGKLQVFKRVPALPPHKRR